MKRLAPVLLLVPLLCAALVLAPAAGARNGLSASDRTQIGVLIDRFVKDAVRREDLPAAWRLIGPGLRGGTTEAAWDAGTGVTVEDYPVRGDDFTRAWTATPIGPRDVILALMFHPDAAHPKVPQTAFKAEVVRRGGRWIVNGWYPAAQFFGGGRVEGPADFGARGPAGSATGLHSRIAPRAFVLALVAIGLLVVGVPLAFWVRARLRSRRAYAAWLATKP